MKLKYPHMMYKGTSTKTAKNEQEHTKLEDKGYTHNEPKDKNQKMTITAKKPMKNSDSVSRQSKKNNKSKQMQGKVMLDNDKQKDMKTKKKLKDVRTSSY